MITTPAPWTVTTKRRWRTASRTGPYVVDAEGRLIADLGRSGPRDGTSEGDANLIAAAPDLLDVLEGLITALDAPALETLLARPRLVVAKARGQS